MLHDDVVKFYRAGFQKHGKSAKAMYWDSAHAQKIRYQAMVRMLPATGKIKLLDVGCGFGDFLLFLANKYRKLDYTGIDIVPEFVEVAGNRLEVIKQKYDNISGRIELVSLEEYTIPAPYVVMIGVLDSLKADNRELVLQMAKGYALAQVACGFSVLSKLKYHGQFPARHPCEVLPVCFALTPHVELCHAYDEEDFMVFMYRKLPKLAKARSKRRY